MKRTGLLTAACICLQLVCSCARQSAHKHSQLSLQRYLTARKHYTEQNLSQALKLLLENHDADPGFSANSFLIGKIYFFNREHDLAEVFWLQTLQNNPHHVDTRKWLSRLYFRQQRCEEAGDMLLPALSDSSEDPELLLLMAKVKRCNRDFAGAIQLYKRSQAFAERLAEASLDLAEIYCTFGLQEKALTELERARGLCGAESSIAQAINAALRQLESAAEEVP